jgi:hypothetical protein
MSQLTNPIAANSNGPELGDPASDGWLRQQCDWNNVEHLIRDGKVLSLYYDFEATDLKHMFAAPTQFSGKIVDVQGRIIDQVKIDIQVPEDVAISPQAALVTQSRPRALYSADGRVSPHIATAMIKQFFKNPYRMLWDKLESTATTNTGAGEEVRVYTIESPDHRKKIELRLHKYGKELSYRFPDRVDYLCEVMQDVQDKRPLAEAAAGVLGADVNDIYDAGSNLLKRDVLARRINAFDGKMDAFMAALQKRMNEGYPAALYQIPKEEHYPNSTNTYYDADGTRWRQITAPAMTKGHNIKRYDDRLLWAFLHRSVNPEIFLTHIKDQQRFRVDTLEVARLVALLDKGREGGFQPGKKYNTATSKWYDSFTLSSLMQANTRKESEERRLDEGVRMPDGTKYDPKNAHKDASYDVDATIALDTYMRKRAPEVVRTIEENTDFDKIKSFLVGTGRFEDSHPVLAFARSIYIDKPKPRFHSQLHFGVCVDINEQIQERRQAVMIRTDLGPLENYTYGGKPLLEMSVEELATMLDKQRNDPNAICEIIDMRKNPPVVPAKMAFDRGKGGNIKRQEQNRKLLLSRRDFCQKLMEAHALAMPPMPDHRSVRVPQAEDHLFTPFAFKEYELEKDVMLVDPVQKALENVVNRNRAIDSAYRRALTSHPVEYETRFDTLNDLIDELHKADKQLDTQLGTKGPAACREPGSHFKRLPEPDADKPFPRRQMKRDKVSDDDVREWSKNAREYLWKLRAELMYEFNDNTARCTVKDFRNNPYGQEIPLAALNQMDKEDHAALVDRLRSGQYKVIPERASWSAELVARMFRDTPGRMEWVKEYWKTKPDCDDRVRAEHAQRWEQWEKYFEALRALRHHGAPHLELGKQRWKTSREASEKDIPAIRRNLVGDGELRSTEKQMGQWDIFVSDHDEAEEILDELEALTHEQLEANPFTPEKMRRVGFDSITKQPIEYAPHKVSAGGKVLIIDVPDHVLEKPLSHYGLAHQFIMIAPDAAQRKALKEAKEGTYLYLRGKESGRKFLAARWAEPPPGRITPDDADYEGAYASAGKLYIDSGEERPADKDFVPITLEALVPVPGGEVTKGVQTIKMRRKEDFMALVSPSLGLRKGMPPLTGIIMRDYGFRPKHDKPVRIQWMTQDPKKPEGSQTESGWEVSTKVLRDGVRTLTLDQAIRLIEAGRTQEEIALALGESEGNAIENLRTKLEGGLITEAHIERVDRRVKRRLGFKDLDSLRKLMNKNSFTPCNARHYGCVGLDGLERALYELFDGDERRVRRTKVHIHFVDIEEAKKEDVRHVSTDRPKMRVAADVEYITPVPVQEQKPDDPDHTQTRGGGDVDRGRGVDKQEVG